MRTCSGFTTIGKTMSLVLELVTFDNVRQIIALRVDEKQSAYVAPNATSIAEGLLNPGGWLRAIFDGGAPVGFVMLFDPNIKGAISRSPTPTDSIVLWRLMIDKSHQKRGYGRAALDLVCKRGLERGASRLLTSFVPGDHGPEQFYLRYGFKPTGVMWGGGKEPELEIKLR
jgi:diamine N-acetyltransferase